MIRVERVCERHVHTYINHMKNTVFTAVSTTQISVL